MNTPEGHGLDNHKAGGLVGNCLFLYILFFVYKILFIPCERRVVWGQKTEQYGVIVLSAGGDGKENGGWVVGRRSPFSLRGVGAAEFCVMALWAATRQRQHGKANWGIR